MIRQNLSREIEPNVTLSEIVFKSIRMRLYTILEPEDLSIGSSSCTIIAVTAVEVGEKTSWQPTQNKAV